MLGDFYIPRLSKIAVQKNNLGVKFCKEVWTLLKTKYRRIFIEGYFFEIKSFSKIKIVLFDSVYNYVKLTMQCQFCSIVPENMFSSLFLTFSSLNRVYFQFLFPLFGDLVRKVMVKNSLVFASIVRIIT